MTLKHERTTVETAVPCLGGLGSGYPITGVGSSGETAEPGVGNVAAAMIGSDDERKKEKEKDEEGFFFLLRLGE